MYCGRPSPDSRRSGHDDGPGQLHTGLHGQLGQLGADVIHGLVEIDAHGVVGGRTQLHFGLGGIEAARIGVQLLQEDALGGDLGARLTVRGTGHCERHRKRGAVARQADDTHVVAEVLATELCADANLASEVEYLVLDFLVAETVALGPTVIRQLIKVVRGGILCRPHGELGRGATHHEGEVVGRAGRGPERTDLRLDEWHERILVQDGLGLLVQVGLVGGTAALGHEEELVGELVTGCGVRIQLDLGGQVRTRVDLFEHGQWSVLGVAQVQPGVGVEDPLGQRPLVRSLGEDTLPALSGNDRGPGVLTHRQDALCGNVRIAQQCFGNESIVGRGLRIVDDRGNLLKMCGAQIVGDVVERGLRQQLQRLGGDLEEIDPIGALDHLDALG